MIVEFVYLTAKTLDVTLTSSPILHNIVVLDSQINRHFDVMHLTSVCLTTSSRSCLGNGLFDEITKTATSIMRTVLVSLDAEQHNVANMAKGLDIAAATTLNSFHCFASFRSRHNTSTTWDW